MKRVLLTLLAVFVVIGLFAAVGYSGYRFGYTQGIRDTADGELLRPGFGRFDEFRPDRMPMWGFGFERGPMRGFPMMGWGFGFFSLLGLLWRVAILVLIVGLVYWLFTRSGWRLTREPQASATPPPPAPVETREEN